VQLSEALQTQLESRFPELFADKDSEDSRMSDGCCFGDGWFPLFEALCVQIQACVERGEVRQPILSQVKAKVDLRIHWREADDAVRQLSNAACEQSLQICEVCGAAGSLMTDAKRRTMRVQVRCVAHVAATTDNRLKEELDT
jgi:hypothetical protein